jgi:2-(3-amino-3-carboxypropyl)histidine synthase
VSLKSGQRALQAALTIQGRLEEAGKEATVVVLDEVGPIQLGNFTEAEAFVETACPRIALNGIPDLHKPILTPSEALVAIGEMDWEKLWGRNYFSVRPDHMVYNEEM